MALMMSRVSMAWGMTKKLKECILTYNSVPFLMLFAYFSLYPSFSRKWESSSVKL